MLHANRGIRSIQQDHSVAGFAEGDFQDLRGVFDHPDDADDRGGVDRFAESFVVEADVASGDGSVEGGARFDQAIDGFAELPHHFGLFGAAEIQAIRGGDGPRAAASHIAGRFGHRVHGSHAGIQLTPAAVAVGREGQRALHGSRFRIFDTHHCRVARAGTRQSVGAHGSVVLLGDPALGGNRRRRQQLQEVLGEVRAFGREGKPIRGVLFSRCRRGHGPLIDRTFFCQGMRGNFRGGSAVVVDAGHAAFGNLADDDGIEAPLLEDRQDFMLAALFRHQQHALLGFAEHDFVGRHAGLALRNFGEFDLDARAAARGHFHSGAGEAGSAHVLNRDDRPGVHGFQAGFEQQFLHEGVADLYIRTLLLRLFGELGGGQQGCAVNPVATCFCADVDHRIADAFRFGEENFFLFGDAQRERIDERILRIARLKADLAADGGNAETVSVTPDSTNYAVEDAEVFSGVLCTGVLACSDLAESQ